ncbi:hypothetical protein Bbelb_430350 [Branchiostoma belcheri]|nr:hypothetical protein Bbelb_430350 [Branchiostoma belcheri]
MCGDIFYTGGRPRPIKRYRLQRKPPLQLSGVLKGQDRGDLPGIKSTTPPGPDSYNLVNVVTGDAGMEIKQSTVIQVRSPEDRGKEQLTAIQVTGPEDHGKEQPTVIQVTSPEDHGKGQLTIMQVTGPEDHGKGHLQLTCEGCPSVTWSPTVLGDNALRVGLVILTVLSLISTVIVTAEPRCAPSQPEPATPDTIQTDTSLPHTLAQAAPHEL